MGIKTSALRNNVIRICGIRDYLVCFESGVSRLKKPHQCRCSGDGFLRLSHKEETVVRFHPAAQERDKDGRILGVSPGGCYGGHAALRHQIVQCHPRVNK